MDWASENGTKGLTEYQTFCPLFSYQVCNRNQASEHWTSKSLLFRCFRCSNICFSIFILLSPKPLFTQIAQSLKRVSNRSCFFYSPRTSTRLQWVHFLLPMAQSRPSLTTTSRNTTLTSRTSSSHSLSTSRERRRPTSRPCPVWFAWCRKFATSQDWLT